MTPPPPRSARIVLVTSNNEVLGFLPAVPAATPWWQDIAPVVEAVRAHYGVEITVLRMLDVGEARPDGIEITYLAETAGPAAGAQAWHGVLDDHPLRLPYAKPGGPAADLRWAKGVLASHGLSPTGPATQVRTWNLSSLWRIPLVSGAAWLKVVPPFFAHEGALLEALAGTPVPSLLGRDGGRILMREIAGGDCYDARQPVLSEMIGLLVDLQRAWVGKTNALFDVGLPDWRAPALAALIGAVIERNGAGLAADDRASLDALMASLPARLAEIAACGLPDTLVHSDFSPGNLRTDGQNLTLLDWGDSGVGCPLLDEPAFLDRIPQDAVTGVRDHWHAAWRAAAPTSDPARASMLLGPIAAARRAAIFQGFLDRIEPSEHPYHLGDPLDWLARTAVLIRAERA